MACDLCAFVLRLNVIVRIEKTMLAEFHVMLKRQADYLLWMAAPAMGGLNTGS